jgi:hypothetical protein
LPLAGLPFVNGPALAWHQGLQVRVWRKGWHVKRPDCSPAGDARHRHRRVSPAVRAASFLRKFSGSGQQMTEKLAFLKNWYQRVWIEADLDGIDTFFLPRAGASGLMPDGQVGPEDFRALVPTLRALVRDLTITIDQSHEDADWLWAHTTARARSAHDLRPVTASGQVMLRFQDGRIAEAYNCFDFLTFFASAGLLPDDAFLLLISGERLG